MKIFSASQIAIIDAFTIENEPVTEIDLMERASLQLAAWLIKNCSNEKVLVVFAGPGNNGGDALAVARIMAGFDYEVRVYLLKGRKRLSGSPALNLERLKDQSHVAVSEINSASDFPFLSGHEYVLDGLFGSGLNRPLDGIASALVNHINQSGCTVVSVDLPSGLFAEDNSVNDYQKIIRANYTLSFQFPKLSFFFAEHEEILGEIEILPIGLHPDAIEKTETPFHFLDELFIAEKIKPRQKFSHKGNFGHALLIAGSYGKMGAAVLASRACLRAGLGLLTSHVPHQGYRIIHSAVPEAMCSIDPSDLMFTEFPDLKQFTAVGVGPGIGQKTNSCRGLKQLLLASPDKLVLDADALNIISANRECISIIPKNTILTPHPREFERLVGESENSFEQLQKQLEFSSQYDCIVVLKGAYTRISLPDGRVYFNTTGNPGMATAGSGDVLTGIILGLLAQHYSAEDAALIGVYLHGLAGDIAARVVGENSLVAGDITRFMGKAFLKLTGK